jgi:hypothetical protein
VRGEAFGKRSLMFVNDFFRGNFPAPFAAKTRVIGEESAHLVAETTQNTTVKKLLGAVA